MNNELKQEVQVPQGATHYQPHQKTYYKRLSATEWELWSERSGWIRSPGTSDSSEWVMLNEIAATPQPPAQAHGSPDMAGMQAAISDLSALVEEQRVLLMEVEDVCGRDGHGGPLEDGESELIDKVRRHLRMLQPAQAEARGDEPVPGAVWEDGGVSLIRRGTEDARCKSRGSLRLYTRPAPAAPQAGEATEEMKAAVRWAPSSAYWSQQLREFFGEDARDGIRCIEQQLMEAQERIAALEASRPMSREGMSRDRIREIFLANGFTIKEGLTDLKPYVYEAARAIERAHGIGSGSGKGAA